MRHAADRVAAGHVLDGCYGAFILAAPHLPDVTGFGAVRWNMQRAMEREQTASGRGEPLSGPPALHAAAGHAVSMSAAPAPTALTVVAEAIEASADPETRQLFALLGRFASIDRRAYRELRSRAWQMLAETEGKGRTGAQLRAEWLEGRAA